MRLTQPVFSLRFLAIATFLAFPILADEPAVEAGGEVAVAASAPADGALARFLAATDGLDMKERYRRGRAMSKDERRQLIAEYQALSQSEREGLKDAIPRGGAGAKARRLNAPEKTGVGTVQYDTGDAYTAIPVIATFLDVGNRFATPFKGSPHSISRVTFQMNGFFFGSLAQVRIYGPPGAGTTAPVLFDTTVTSTAIGTPIVFTLPTAVTGLTDSFLIGILQDTLGPTPTTTGPANPAVDVLSGGQGFNGMSIVPPPPTTPTQGTGFNGAPTVAPGVPFNAIIRATGNNLPVELMSFTVDDE
ncbi:MAG: hypothetical protein MI919_04430 [Holophagales bacterium]|nr:hypothetical protein [Holophagales bacterium]